MFVRPFNKIPLNTEMRKNSERSLGMTKGISTNSNFGYIPKLVIQPSEPLLKINNDILIIRASLIMLYDPTTKHFPILSF